MADRVRAEAETHIALDHDAVVRLHTFFEVAPPDQLEHRPVLGSVHWQHYPLVALSVGSSAP